MNRPRRLPPHDAAVRIEKLAAEGWSMKGIAKTLGTDHETMRRMMEDHPALREAFDNGRERERHALHNALYVAAMNGQIAAAMFLLKARHGYREGDQSDTANRVSIEFRLPGALKPEQFTTTLENEPTTIPSAQRLSASRS
jgi:hypothetical protein